MLNSAREKLKEARYNQDMEPQHRGGPSKLKEEKEYDKILLDNPIEANRYNSEEQKYRDFKNMLNSAREKMNDAMYNQSMQSQHIGGPSKLKEEEVYDKILLHNPIEANRYDEELKAQERKKAIENQEKKQ